MDLGIRDRVAIVAASSKGLGRAVAEALAAEGVRLALCARSLEGSRRPRRRSASATGPRCSPAPSTSASPPEIARFVDDVATELGRVDICIANAPGPPIKRFMDATLEDWRQAIELNLLASVEFARATLPRMVAGGWGRLVMMSSIVAKQPEDGFLLSNAVRPGVSGLVRSRRSSARARSRSTPS